MSARHSGNFVCIPYRISIVHQRSATQPTTPIPGTWSMEQGHQYTIIDSSWGGILLTAEEVQNIHIHRQ